MDGEIPVLAKFLDAWTPGRRAWRRAATCRIWVRPCWACLRNSSPWTGCISGSGIRPQGSPSPAGRGAPPGVGSRFPWRCPESGRIGPPAYRRPGCSTGRPWIRRRPGLPLCAHERHGFPEHHPGREQLRFGTHEPAAQHRAQGPAYATLLRQSTMMAFVGTFWIMGSLCLCLLPVLLLIRKSHAGAGN